MRRASTGRVSRYRSHREAIKGSFLWPFRYGRKFAYIPIGASLGTVLAKFIVGEPGEIPATLVIQLCVLLAAWPVGGVVLYAANVLAGGIMSRAERSRTR